MADVNQEAEMTFSPGPNQDITSGNGSGQPGTPSASGVIRDPGDIPAERKELVKAKTEAIRRARKYWDCDFKRMRDDQDFLLGKQWQGQTDIEDERYVVNITQRHVQQRVAAVYAKNPTVVARRKEMMDFKLWDENPLSYQMASQLVAQTGQMLAAANAGDQTATSQLAMAATNPAAQQELAAAQELMADIQQGVLKRSMKTRVCRTVELYFRNKVLTQQNPPFKASMKQLVRRTGAIGIGYLKLGLVREMGDRPKSPDELKGMATLQEQMAQIDLFMANLMDRPDLMSEAAKEKEELRLALEALQKTEKITTQEGIVFDFPSGTSIIPDEGLVHLQGFVGCQNVSEEYLLTVDQVQKLWNVDVSGHANVYDPADPSKPVVGPSKDQKDKGKVCVWENYDRNTGLRYWVCDGYPNFLEEPASPPLTLERFYPWYALAFNYLEHFKQRFPLSDVFLLRHQQREMNRAREGLRQHRVANRPVTYVPRGMLSEADITKMETRPAHAVVQLDAMQPGSKIDDVLQNGKNHPIAPELYDVTPVYQDVLRAVGDQEANLGGTSKSTATESSIAESSRVSSLQSNMDDLDDFLTEVMRDAGKVALMEIGRAHVVKAVGDGAAWPTLSKQDIADEIFLEIQAGSSGRPNKAMEVQNFTQAAPILLQIPGLSPEWLGRQILTRLDDRLDLTDAFIAGQPSIQTLNALAAKPLGQGPAGGEAGGSEDPNSQGEEGGQNAAGPSQGGGGLGPQAQNRMAPAAPPVQQ